MTNDEIASRLEAFGRPDSPFSRFSGGDDEIARRMEAFGRLDMMNSAEAFAVYEMKRSRQED